MRRKFDENQRPNSVSGRALSAHLCASISESWIPRKDIPLSFPFSPEYPSGISKSPFIFSFISTQSPVSEMEK